jgi:hypothetical protein
MGLYDTVLLLDEAAAACSDGHPLRSFQTKDFDSPSMNTYVVHGGRLYLASPGRCWSDEDDSGRWRIEGDEAVREDRYALKQVVDRRAIRVYSQCDECEPILVRTDARGLFGDLVHEHALLVDFRLTFRPGEPVSVERLTGTREDMRADLRARGLYVLADEEPLAIAHREVKRAQESLARLRGERRSWP